MGERQPEYVGDLANALHNIAALIAGYDDGFLNDETFRQRELRPFDRKWALEANSPLRLERELDDFATLHNACVAKVPEE